MPRSPRVSCVRPSPGAATPCRATVPTFRGRCDHGTQWRTVLTISIRRSVLLGAALVLTLLVAADRSTLAAKKTLAAVSPAAATPPPAGQVYTVDSAHSFVEFSVRLIGFNRVRGSFPQYEAHVYYDSVAVERSSVSVRVSVEGVDTHNTERDHHLESPDFFDAKKYPF